MLQLLRLRAQQYQQIQEYNKWRRAQGASHSFVSFRFVYATLSILIYNKNNYAHIKKKQTKNIKNVDSISLISLGCANAMQSLKMC